MWRSALKCCNSDSSGFPHTRSAQVPFASGVCAVSGWEARESYVAVGVVNVEANVATRHDILVYLLKSNVERNFATSVQRANWGGVVAGRVLKIHNDSRRPGSFRLL